MMCHTEHEACVNFDSVTLSFCGNDVEELILI